jgi:hypothetical protein
MLHRIVAASAAICAVALIGIASAAPAQAQALSAKECRAKFQAARTAGTLAGKKYADFRKTECGATAATGTPTTPAAAPTTPAAAPVATGNVVYPKALDPKYAKESAGRGRMHTCRDQYRANKATNANGGLRWIMKGGGYYSECNKRLKA